MVTTGEKKSGEFGLDQWDEPILYPLYTGLVCAECGSPVMAFIGLERRSDMPRSVKRRRRIYACILCDATTFAPIPLGKRRQVGEVDTQTFRMKKRKRALDKARKCAV